MHQDQRSDKSKRFQVESGQKLSLICGFRLCLERLNNVAGKLLKHVPMKRKRAAELISATLGV